jgi:hypothetical protein
MQPGPYPYPVPAAPPAGGQQHVRPATWWFAVAGVVAAVGIVGAVVVAVVGVEAYTDRIEGFDRADLPATLQVEITETGGYSIYQEYTGAYDGFFRPSPEVTVTDPSGGPVALDRYDASVTYHAAGHEGRGEYTFEATETGTYTVTASGSTGSAVAVGRGIGTGLFTSIGAALLLGFGGVVAGAVIAIVVGVRRSRARRALLPAFGGWGPPPPGGWAPPSSGGWGSPGPGRWVPPGPGAGPPPAGWGPRSPGAPPPPPPGRALAPPPGTVAPGGAAAPGTAGRGPMPPPPPRPTDATPLPRRPSDAAPLPPRPSDTTPLPPRANAGSSAPPRPTGAAPLPPRPTDGASPPAHRGDAVMRATDRDRGVADPPSLRSPADWSRSDVPLHWSHRS